MARYAENTDVPSDKSRAEIERTLRRYGCGGFMYGWSGAKAMVGFDIKGRRIQFVLQMPDPDSDEFAFTPERGLRRSETQREAAYEQAVKQRWRALALVIKAKLEAVETGISTFEDEFLSWTMLPGGMSVGEWIQPQISKAYQTGRMPALLPLLKGEQS